MTELKIFLVVDYIYVSIKRYILVQTHVQIQEYLHNVYKRIYLCKINVNQITKFAYILTFG